MKKILIIVPIFLLTFCANSNQETVPPKISIEESIQRKLREKFPENDIVIKANGNKILISHKDSMNVWGSPSYEHLVVEEIVLFTDTLLNTTDSLEVHFEAFDQKAANNKYGLSKHNINTIIKNHTQIPKLLEYKYYLTHTMGVKECHVLLSALDGLSDSWKDPGLKTDFFEFALKYGEARSTGNKEKEKYYKAVMDALYEGYSSPELKDQGVNAEHIRGLMKILE